MVRTFDRCDDALFGFEDGQDMQDRAEESCCAADATAAIKRIQGARDEICVNILANFFRNPQAV